ncbi:MAG: hypothetical protein JWQ62_2583 [Lacunisphaera sp.]|nr:hypothetical protein [Lacunisphaera sp.]
MGFFDRSSPSGSETPEKSAAGGGVLPQLATAREKLKAKDLPAALAIYETVLTGASERSDVLMTISADLGTNGHVREIIELLAPRYDVEKHGAPAGINLLQAYLATRNAEAAQHLLDLLYSLQRPELEGRLNGFSNAVAELFISDAEADHVASAASGPAEEGEKKIALVSISKPMWFYGLEGVAPRLLPRKEGKLRRVAFVQCSLPGLENVTERAAQPEDDLGRFCRGLALWLADTFTFSAGYEPVAAVGTMAQHYALFPMEWTAENLRQLNETVSGGLDYVVTGSLRHRNADFELTLRIWEVKKFRELKAFTARWSPATADAELTQLLGQLRAYMEWTALPGEQGLAATLPVAPLAYVQALGAELTFFLGEKGILPPDQMPADAALLLRAAQLNPDHAGAQLALAAQLLRQKSQGLAPDPEAYRLVCAWLASPAAQAADVSALLIKLA